MAARRASPAEHDAIPVMVPRNDRKLVPVSPARVDRLRAHLLRMLVGISDGPVAATRSEPEGFAARVAGTACAMCGGSCCRNGADDGFLDDVALMRGGIGLPADAVMRRYLTRVPEVGYEGSCIFHGKSGCTLDRSMRSDVCNSYFCGGLHAWLNSSARPEPTVIIAGEGNAMRTSPVLLP